MKKIGLAIVFILAIASLSSCKSTNSCSSVEKQELKSNLTIANYNLEANT